MSFKDFTYQMPVVGLLQKSLERGRLAHAYLFTGSSMPLLEGMATTVAKTLNCKSPPQKSIAGMALDCCDQCTSCTKIQQQNHADVSWVYPESKSRIITVDQMRELMKTMHLKPLEAAYKVAVIGGADRMNPQAANAFLKTLEEPPQQTIILLLSSEPQRLLDTILSRCLRLNFAGDEDEMRRNPHYPWLQQFCELASTGKSSLMGRYRLLSHLMNRLAGLREEIETSLTARSPLEKYDEVDASLKEKWEDELKAAIEAEYRRQRIELLSLVQSWFRDIWILAHQQAGQFLFFPSLAELSKAFASRLSSKDAMSNLKTMERTMRLMETNVQEALALEVCMLKICLDKC
jgi:DNA polymerase-3 subunit delta'